jgi:hypothetical protein
MLKIRVNGSEFTTKSYREISFDSSSPSLYRCERDKGMPRDTLCRKPVVYLCALFVSGISLIIARDDPLTHR